MAAASHTARLFVCSGLASLSLAGAAAPAASGQPTEWGGPPQLYVDTIGDQSELQIALDFSAAGPPARVSLAVPEGFELYPQRPPGTFVGDAEIYAAAGGYGTSTVSVLNGEVTAAPLDAATEAAAQSCSARRPIAVWQIELSLLGQPLVLPIDISPQDPPRGGLRLDLCTPTLSATAAEFAPVLPISSISLALQELDPPQRHGTYIWSGIITPLAPDQHTPRPDNAYELRAIVPVPNLLTLRARYQPTSHRAMLSGSLSADGRPRPNVRVFIFGLERKVTPGGIVYGDFEAGSTTTDATGRYRFRYRIKRTTGFVAVVRNAESKCRGQSAAPAGCLSTTIAASRSDTVTVSVPHH